MNLVHFNHIHHLEYSFVFLQKLILRFINPIKLAQVTEQQIKRTYVLQFPHFP